MSDERAIRSIPWTQQHDVIGSDDVEAVHRHSLEILERAGVTTTNKRLFDVMEAHGQKVDRDSYRIWLDPAFVEEKVAMVPKEYDLCARDPRLDLKLDHKQGYLSTDGCPAEYIDLETGKRRYSTKADISDITTLADALPQIGFIWQSASANDVPVPVRPMHEIHAQFPHTTKHLQQMTAIDPFNARGIVEMASAIAGSSEALRERPIISNFQCSISPLHWDDGPIDALQLFAEAGVPVGICSMPLAGASSPLSVAGLVTMANAEILSGWTILQTLVPGAKSMYISYASTNDMSSGMMNPAWGGLEVFSCMATTTIARRYGVPFSVWSFAPGAKYPDWQGGAQSGMSGMAMALNPGNLVNGAGSLLDDSVYSLAELVLDAELFETLVRFAEGYTFTTEDFATDAVIEVGPGGHFLDQDHTLANMRTFIRDTSMDRRNWDDWEAQGRPQPPEVATEKAKKILAEHEPEPLPEDVAAELDRIMDAYEAQAVAEAS
jgi:trimethylamine--corrinoid protein Co-methyltransferase